MKKHLKLLLACIIILAVFLYIKHKRNIQSPFFRIEEIKKFPDISFVDIFNNKFNTESLSGQIIYLQFFDPRDPDDLDLLDKIYSNWHSENLKIIIITKNLRNLRKKFINSKYKNIIITKEYSILKKAFKSPRYQNTYYIFDKAGRLKNWGRNSIGYERGPKIYLKQLIKGEFFKIEDFIPGKNIFDIPWFQNLMMNIQEKNSHENNFLLIGLFTSFCNSCLSGILIEKMRELARLNNIKVFGILNSDYYQEDDLIAIKSQSGVEFPLYISDEHLRQKWSGYIEEFREDELNNIIIVLEKTGKILKIFHKNCNCYNEFFTFIRDL